MHPNSIFHTRTEAQNLSYARHRSFGLLSVNGPTGPLVSHIPFLLNDDGSRLDAHLMKTNPIVELIDETIDAVVAISGPDAYISPDWYDIENQVPTWNYVAVHLRGRLHRQPDRALPGLLDRLSSAMEQRLAPKQPWTTAKMETRIYQNMQRIILPVSMDITQVQGTWKLSQNKSESARLGAANAVERSTLGSEAQVLADLMRSAKKP